MRNSPKLPKAKISRPAETPDEIADPEAEQRRDEESFVKPKAQEEQLVSGKDDFNWDSYIEEFNSTSSSAPSMREINEELPSFENVLTKTTSLEDHLALAAFDDCAARRREESSVS